jgi:hypothetical protein
MESHDPITGEIITDDRPINAQVVHAADGFPVPKTAQAASQMLRLLEEGQFDAEVSHDMRDLVCAMEAHAHNNKGIAKGKLLIEVDLTLANGVFVATGAHKVKKPVQKRMGTALFARDNGALGRNPPGQSVLFGSRDIEDIRETRDI